jgi:hypothetical protein
MFAHFTPTVKFIKTFFLLLTAMTLAGCAHDADYEESYSKSAYHKGRADARSELSKGVLAIESFGLPPPWVRLYEKILKERYGIEDRTVAGCMVNDEIIGHAKGFNEVMEREIKKRWPEDVFEQASIEAHKEYQRREDLRMKTLPDQPLTPEPNQ